MTPLILKRASASQSSGQWRDDDYDVLEDGVVVGRIFKARGAGRGARREGRRGGGERAPFCRRSGRARARLRGPQRRISPC